MDADLTIPTRQSTLGPFVPPNAYRCVVLLTAESQASTAFCRNDLMIECSEKSDRR